MLHESGTLLVEREMGDFKWGVFAGIMAKGRTPKILIVKAKGSSRWGLPGGGVEWQDIWPRRGQLRFLSQFKEALWEALQREIKEELGLILPDAKWRDPAIFISENPEIKDIAVVYPIFIPNFDIPFFYQVADKPLPLDSELEEVAFVSKEKVLLPPDAIIQYPLLGPRMTAMIEFCFTAIKTPKK